MVLFLVCFFMRCVGVLSSFMYCVLAYIEVSFHQWCCDISSALLWVSVFFVCATVLYQHQYRYLCCVVGSPAHLISEPIV
jgi:hypothetical protein